MTWLSWLYIALALLSAVMWLAAAKAKAVQLPETAFFQAGVGGGRPSPEFDAILKQLRLQSGLNAAAAVLMAISALVQLAQFVWG
jgi:hypothetical protein